jgi:hypothetical protein
LLKGKAIDSALLGTWEGSVSKRTGESKFDDKTRIPLRITFSSLEKASNFAVWEPGKTLKDGARYTIGGTVENFDHAVRSSTGKCLRSLASLGDSNPWLGAPEGGVQLVRMAGMHFPGDQVLVFTYPKGTSGLSPTGMQGLRYAHPGGLLQTDPNDEWGSIQFFPHSAPNGNTVKLHPVSGGGESCQ